MITGGFRANGFLPISSIPLQGLALLHCTWQELYPIILSNCMIWAPLWANRRICFYCDNQAVIAILSTKSSKIPCVMNFVWLITFQTLSFNFTFTARYRHIPQVNNVIADSLSRFQMSMFRLLAPDASPAPCPIPT